MCPEQAGGEAVVDARGDVYSLGAVLFYCLARRPPFEGQSVGKLLAAHLTERPPFLSTLNAAIPEDLARQVDRCLAKDPKERFQTIREMEHALALCACANNWTLAQAQAWWADVGKPANTVKQVPDVTTEKMGKGTS
jgi:serine/threonine-protein kinase